MSSDVSHIGNYYTAQWKVTSTSATSVELTYRVTIPKGNYILIGSFPECSSQTGLTEMAGTSNVIFPSMVNVYAYTRSYGHFVFSFSVTEDNSQVWLSSASSAQMTYSQTGRGYIRAIRVGDN